MLPGNDMTSAEQDVWTALAAVSDPEIPVLSVLDLGVVRAVSLVGAGVEVIITPTYSGCPAMSAIATAIRMELAARGYNPVQVKETYSPAWTTDWMSEAGKEKLRAYGIAPPVAPERAQRLLFDAPPVVPCPHCGSEDTALISEFGSTACKALMRCEACLEPFDYFKCLR